jgi:hypothetical protein
VLDDVQRRAFLVQPARKGAAPLVVAAAHVELHKGAGELFLLPRRGPLTGAQADDRVADAHRLARLDRHVAADAIALVEEADHRAALRHRGAAGIDRGGIPLHCHDIGRDILGRLGKLLARGRRAARGGVIAVAGDIPDADAEQGGAADRGRRDRRLHASGLHAS